MIRTTLPKLYIMIGLPGSGKSTYVKNVCSSTDSSVYVSSDEIRKELFGDESIQNNPEQVFYIMRTRALDYLNKGYDVYYDATNLTRKDRSQILKECPNFAVKIAMIMFASIETCIKRDSERERSVGKDVIDRMVRRFQYPYFDEGFDEILVRKTEAIDEEEYSRKCLREMNINHDNIHHKDSTVLNHCFSVYDYFKNNNYDMHLAIAGKYHDIGKPYCKTFINTKGETTDEAHFYNHENVGAYMSCGLDVDNLISWIISNHMEPFHNSKYYRNLPEYLKNILNIFNEVDKNNP